MLVSHSLGPPALGMSSQPSPGPPLGLVVHLYTLYEPGSPQGWGHNAPPHLPCRAVSSVLQWGAFHHPWTLQKAPQPSETSVLKSLSTNTKTLSPPFHFPRTLAHFTLFKCTGNGRVRSGGDLLLPLLSSFAFFLPFALAVSPKAPQTCPLVDTTLLTPCASASSLPQRTCCACMICSCVLLPRISLHLTTRKFTIFQLNSLQSPLRTGARNLHPSAPSPPSASQPNFLLLLHASIAAPSPPFPLLQERLSTHGHRKHCPPLSPSLPFRPHLMLPAPFRIFPTLVSCTWLHSCLVRRRAPCLPYTDHSKDPAKSHKYRISPLSRQPLFSSQQVNPPWLCLGTLSAFRRLAIFRAEGEGGVGGDAPALQHAARTAAPASRAGSGAVWRPRPKKSSPISSSC